MSRISIGRMDGGQHFAACGVEVGFGGLALGTVVKNGADVVGRQLGNRRFRIVDGFAPTEVRVDRGSHGPTQRHPKCKRHVGQGAAGVDEPRLSDERKQSHGPAKLGIREVLKSLSGVIEPREG